MNQRQEEPPAAISSPSSGRCHLLVRLLHPSAGRTALSHSLEATEESRVSEGAVCKSEDSLAVMVTSTFL